MTRAAPIYSSLNCKPAYQLNWSVTLFWKHPVPETGWIARLKESTEQDGVRILEHRLKSERVSQFLTSTEPDVAPDKLLRSVKGRLQYLVRDRFPKAFQRNYAVRSVGWQRREVIETYVASQTKRHLMGDANVQERFEKFQIFAPLIDLSQARHSSHGLFWHNLHLVLVNDARWMEIQEERLRTIHDILLRVARKKGHLLSRGGILADHIHLSLGCGLSESPSQVALAYMNNLAFVLGKKPIFEFSYYVGTFGEYDLGVMWSNRRSREETRRLLLS
jgi:REP element-mobilizing transposase RayT